MVAEVNGNCLRLQREHTHVHTQYTHIHTGEFFVSENKKNNQNWIAVPSKTTREHIAHLTCTGGTKGTNQGAGCWLVLVHSRRYARSRCADARANKHNPTTSGVTHIIYSKGLSIRLKIISFRI